MWPVKNWVFVCWWWWFDWSFASLVLPVVTTTSIIISSSKIHIGDPHWRCSGTGIPGFSWKKSLNEGCVVSYQHGRPIETCWARINLFPLNVFLSRIRLYRMQASQCTLQLMMDLIHSLISRQQPRVKLLRYAWHAVLTIEWRVWRMFLQCWDAIGICLTRTSPVLAVYIGGVWST